MLCAGWEVGRPGRGGRAGSRCMGRPRKGLRWLRNMPGSMLGNMTGGKSGRCGGGEEGGERGGELRQEDGESQTRIRGDSVSLSSSPGSDFGSVIGLAWQDRLTGLRLAQSIRLANN